ncbi:MAG: putative metal-binding motif-containing protein [Myxococcota bacterium]|nr:putative metal-binding motif-containing protein [Myxococcota bacterium]
MIWLLLAGCGRDCPEVDSDGDGAPEACPGETATADGFIDCDDSDSAARPGASEECDGIDNDCDGAVDEGLGLTYYADIDGDGYGDLDTATDTCSPPADYVLLGGDCNDNDATISPLEDEICDGVDNDCDGTPDDGAEEQLWYADLDGDGTPGEESDPILSCVAPSGYLATPETWDCDDDDDTIGPHVEEDCDGIDNNCNGQIDEGVPSIWYIDDDDDGLGSSTVVTGEDCAAPAGYALNSDDCDDSDESVGLVFPDPLDGDGVVLEAADIADLCPCYTAIGGTLRIRNVEDTTDLMGLSCIESAEKLQISDNISLTSLAGLDGLEVVEGSALIQDNAQLASLAGLSGLIEIDSTLSITGNTALADLSGLESLTTISGGLTISDNAAMTDINLSALETVANVSISTCSALISFSGMPLLTEVERGLSIDGCESLTTIDLPALSTIGSDLYIYKLAELTELSLPALTDVGGELRVHWAAGITDLDGLSGVRLVGDDLVLWGNAALFDVTGMHTVEQIGGDLSIQNNTDLSTEDAESMRDTIGEDNIRGTVIISNNG